MSSSRKVTANRANARRSTGPQSIHGKAQSRLNSLKHGLASPAAALPELTRDISELAQKLAGDPFIDHALLEAATQVVAAAVDINRIRRVRHDLLERMLADPEFHEPPLPWEPMPIRPIRIRYTMAMRIEASRNGALDQQIRKELAQLAAQWAYESEVRRIKQDLAAARHRAQERKCQWDQLARFERYERRAVSRRNTAIRAFDEALAAAQKAKDHNIG
jgi:hypothetical protein